MRKETSLSETQTDLLGQNSRIDPKPRMIYEHAKGTHYSTMPSGQKNALDRLKVNNESASADAQRLTARYDFGSEKKEKPTFGRLYPG